MYDGNEWQALTQIPTATETTAGIVELADAIESVDETNNNRVLTPKSGGQLIDEKIQQASTNVVGKTRYATKNETDAGNEDEAALTPASIKNLLNKLEQLEFNVVDTGLIMWMAGPKKFVPEGWMHCDGSRIYNNGETAKLYQKLKNWDNPWGNGPSSDVVRIPDLRGRFVRGFQDGTGRDPANTQFGGSQDDQFEEHDHPALVKDPGHTHTIEGYKGKEGANRSPEQVIVDDDYDVNDKETDQSAALDRKTGITVDVKKSGGGETRPKNINLTPVIKL
jgi:microcystin-dependent protein